MKLMLRPTDQRFAQLVVALEVDPLLLDDDTIADACKQVAALARQQLRDTRRQVTAAGVRTAAPDVRERLSAECWLLARHHGCGPQQVMSPSREKAPARARQELAWLAVRNAHLSTTQAGRILERDHSTIVHATGKIGREIAYDDLLDARLEQTWTQACRMAAGRTREAA